MSMASEFATAPRGASCADNDEGGLVVAGDRSFAGNADEVAGARAAIAAAVIATACVSAHFVGHLVAHADAAIVMARVLEASAAPSPPAADAPPADTTAAAAVSGNLVSAASDQFAACVPAAWAGTSRAAAAGSATGFLAARAEECLPWAVAAVAVHGGVEAVCLIEVLAESDGVPIEAAPQATVRRCSPTACARCAPQQSSYWQLSWLHPCLPVVAASPAAHCPRVDQLMQQQCSVHGELCGSGRVVAVLVSAPRCSAPAPGRACAALPRTSCGRTSVTVRAPQPEQATALVADGARRRAPTMRVSYHGDSPKLAAVVVPSYSASPA